MLKINTAIWIFFLSTVFCYSQSDSLKLHGIQIKSHEIDNGLSKPISKKIILIDTIKVTTEEYKWKLKVISEFKNSGSQLLIEFYYDQDSLILIRFTELSKEFNYGINANKITEFYYENDNFIEEQISIQISNPIIGVGIPKPSKWNEIYGYNPRFTFDFLQSYAALLLTKIKK